MIRLRLFGGASIEEGGAVLTGVASRRHPLALVSVLAAAPTPTVARSKLVGLLWPEVPEDRARGRLNSCLHRLRGGLGEDAVRSVGDDLELDPEQIWSDVEAFERALEEGEPEEAVELYAGRFLDGFHLPDSPEFEKWVDRTGDRFERRYRAALEELAEAAEAAGDTTGAAAWWNRRVNADPYDTRVVMRLMEALARAGNRAGALRVARVHGRLLDEELGAEPGPELGRLVGRLQRGEQMTAVETAKAARSSDVVDAPPEPRPPEHPGEEARADGVEPGPPPSAGAGRAARRRRALVVGGSCLVLAAAAVWLFAVSSERTGAGAAGAPSVAVLPFEPVGDTPAQELAAGLHRDLLTRLSNVGGLKVVSGTSVQRYGKGRSTVGEIARDLDVRWVIEGTVQRSGEQLQVNVQLIDAHTDTHAWARTYRRTLGEAGLGGVFDVQADVTANVAKALGERLSDAERSRIGHRPTDDLTAFRLYVEGRRHLEQRTPRRLALAAESFDRALVRDSGYALAWAGLADAVDLARTYGVKLPAGYPEPEKAARRAVELAPQLGEAHSSLGRALFRSDVPAAVRQLRTAVELQPSYAQAHHWLGYLELAFGDLERARTHLELAVELNPGLLPARGNLARLLLAEGRYEEALSTSRSVQREATQWGHGAALDELTALYHLGRWDELTAAARRHEEAGVDFRDQTQTFIALGDLARADTAAARRRLSGIEHRFWTGVARAALGDLGAAFASFDQGAEDAPRGPWYVTAWRYYFPEALDPVRADPRFDGLMRDVRAKWGIEPGETLDPGR